MIFADIDVFLQEEREGEEDDQEQSQSVEADVEAAQVFLLEIHFCSFCFNFAVCLIKF